MVCAYLPVIEYMPVLNYRVTLQIDMLHKKYNLWCCKAYTRACVFMKNEDAKLSLHPLYRQCELPTDENHIDAEIIRLGNTEFFGFRIFENIKYLSLIFS